MRQHWQLLGAPSRGSAGLLAGSVSGMSEDAMGSEMQITGLRDVGVEQQSSKRGDDPEQACVTRSAPDVLTRTAGGATALWPPHQFGADGASPSPVHGAAGGASALIPRMSASPQTRRRLPCAVGGAF